jgi:DNA-binding transcriptional ArsR family regulator
MVVVQEVDDRVDHLFQAVSDATRRDILRQAGAGEYSVSKLADRYPMSFAAVQKHVAVLEKAGLVRKQIAGRERLVIAVPKEIARARACLQQLEALWRHRITALDAVLSQPKE